MTALHGNRTPTVALVLRSVNHYRVPFLEGLRTELAGRGIALQLVHGVGSGTFAERGDQQQLDWAVPVPSRGVSGRLGRLVWQPVLGHVRDADLVVTSQQTQYLANYPLLAMQMAGRQRVAFWGHGRNFQEWRASGPGEAVKRWMSRRVHWWFAYNDLSARVVAELGYPPERITSTQNAIDTRELRELRASVTAEEVDAVRERLGVDPGRRGRVAVHVGGLYADKRLDVLVDAAQRIRAEVEGFEMIVAGAGTHQWVVEEAAARFPWFHYVGPAFGRDKVALFELARLQLIPGLVGLAVLDSFALGTPLVTLDDSPHSPEIDYLRSGQNGLMVAAGPDPAAAYAAAVAPLLRDEDAVHRLVEGAEADGERYTIEEMVRRFADGVEAALAEPAHPSWSGPSGE